MGKKQLDIDTHFDFSARDTAGVRTATPRSTLLPGVHYSQRYIATVVINCFSVQKMDVGKDKKVGHTSDSNSFRLFEWQFEACTIKVKEVCTDLQAS